MSEKEAAQREMEQELTRLFGETSYRVERKACRGKYHGHYDYSLVFGSGRHLYIGMDRRCYERGLRVELEFIRWFRGHQAENAEKIRAVLVENNTPFSAVAVEITPSGKMQDLFVYGTVSLSTENGDQFLYRETGMHYFLIGADHAWCSFESCMKTMLNDIQGEMCCMQPITGDTASERRL